MAITARDKRDLNEIFKRLWAQAGFTYGAMEQGAQFGDLIADGLAPLDALASTDVGEGASMIGVEDASAKFTGDNVEEVLEELYDLVQAGVSQASLQVEAPTELTIAGGVVTATQSYHTLDTEADAASDDLDTISGLSDGQFVILKIANSGRNVVLKHGTGNLNCIGGMDVTMDVTGDVALAFKSSSTIYVLSLALATLSGGGIGAWLASTASAKGASGIGINDTGSLITATTVEAALQELRTSLVVKAATELTIAGGIVTATQSYHTLDTEADAASDDLDTISGLVDGQFAVFRIENSGRNVVLKSGAGNIFCPGGADITLDATTDAVLAMRLGASVFVLAMELATLSGGGLGKALSSGATGLGASMVALEDAGALFATDNVEAALAALATVTRVGLGAPIIKLYTNAVLADDGTMALVAPTTSAVVIVTSGDEVGIFGVLAAGTVVMAPGSTTNVDDADTDNTLVLYNNGGIPTVKNRLGGARGVTAIVVGN